MVCDFADSLEYVSPAHGSWNLAHICGLLPEAHILFVTPAGCSRVITLSALERGLKQRFSTLDVTEGNLINGDIEQLVIDGATELIGRLTALGRRPKVLMIVVSCIDGFIGTDHQVFLTELQARFADIEFLVGFMDPINRKTELPPVAHMQLQISQLWRKSDIDERAVNFIGSYLPPDPAEPFLDYLQQQGYALRHAYTARTLAEQRAMGDSSLNIVTAPTALVAAKDAEQRLGIPYLTVWPNYDFGQIAAHIHKISTMLDIPLPDAAVWQQDVEAKLANAAEALRGWQIVIDDSAILCPFSLALLLLAHGFAVRRLFISQCLPIERQAAQKLAETAADLEIIQRNAPEMAQAHDSKRYYLDKCLAIGENAAYFCHSEHYVEKIAMSGDFGYQAISELLAQMLEAVATTKALPDIQQNGRGCSLI